jgi:hypothetical protein
MSTRAAAWLAWSLWALALMAIAADVAFQVLNASTPTAAPRGPAALGIGFFLVFMSFATVGALVASRQPRKFGSTPRAWMARKTTQAQSRLKGSRKNFRSTVLGSLGCAVVLGMASFR